MHLHSFALSYVLSFSKKEKKNSEKQEPEEDFHLLWHGGWVWVATTPNLYSRNQVGSKRRKKKEEKKKKSPTYLFTAEGRGRGGSSPTPCSEFQGWTVRPVVRDGTQVSQKGRGRVPQVEVGSGSLLCG